MKQRTHHFVCAHCNKKASRLYTSRKPTVCLPCVRKKRSRYLESYVQFLK